MTSREIDRLAEGAHSLRRVSAASRQFAIQSVRHATTVLLRNWIAALAPFPRALENKHLGPRTMKTGGLCSHAHTAGASEFPLTLDPVVLLHSGTRGTVSFFGGCRHQSPIGTQERLELGPEVLDGGAGAVAYP